jgi:hypothetical protein
MSDLATLLTQHFQHAHNMDNIIKAIYIPENITHAGQAHCKEYLGRALDHMIKMGDTFRTLKPELAATNYCSSHRGWGKAKIKLTQLS